MHGEADLRLIPDGAVSQPTATAEPARQAGPDGSHEYRPDIDGLRALAVTPVVLFHAGITAFSGGYIGVDVFFVISGFLITRILVQSMQEGRYSIVDFYQRRARRIFPALAFVSLATLLAGYFILPPTDYASLGRSEIFISGFVSNFYFWKSVGYFEAASTFHPALHTWSLAVEEQFYIFFPILLYFLHGNRKLLFPLLGAIFVVSLASAAVMLEWKPRVAFYLLPCRAWELMAGGILALGLFERFWSPARAAIAATAGLVFILASIFLYTEATPFPGFAAVPPVLGACLLIWARGEGAGRLLAARPVVWIGLLSYSLYLWHVPIFEFAKYLTGGALPLSVGLALSLVSVGAAWFSLTFVERPFRAPGRKAWIKHRALVAWLGLAAMALAGGAVYALDGLPGRMSPQDARTLAIGQDKARHHVECLSLDTVWVDPAKPCVLGTSGATPATLLWGDSHAMVTATSLEAAARRQHAAFLFAADADCPIGLGFDIDPTVMSSLVDQGHYRRCGEYNRSMLARALRRDITTVVLSARWTNWRIGEPANPAEGAVDIRLRNPGGKAGNSAANKAIFERGFAELVDRLRQAGKRIVVVGPLPEPPYDVPHRTYVSQFGLWEPPASLSVADYRKRHAAILAFFVTLQGKADFVWPVQALCRDEQCPVVADGLPLYFDHNHLSVARARDASLLYDFIFRQDAPRAAPPIR